MNQVYALKPPEIVIDQSVSSSLHLWLPLRLYAYFEMSFCYSMCKTGLKTPTGMAPRSVIDKPLTSSIEPQSDLA